MAVTTPYQASFNGLAVGNGTNAQLVGWDQIRAIPGLRQGDVVKPRQDGNFAGLDFLDERIFTMDLLVFAPTVPVETVLSAIAAAFQPIMDPAGQLPFEFFLPGWANSCFITCRPTKGGFPIDTDYQFGKVSVPIEMTASDPLVYSTVLKTVTAGLPSPTAGLTFPVTFPVVFGASTGSSVSVTNSGNYVTAPVVTITGPVTNPGIVFSATGAFMQFNLTLGSTDVLVIDMGARTVTLNGTAYRFNAIVTGSSWWGIPPGTWSIGVYSGDSTTVSASFQIAYRDAWAWR